MCNNYLTLIKAIPKIFLLSILLFVLRFDLFASQSAGIPVEIVGTQIVPHHPPDMLKFDQYNTPCGARVQLFLKNISTNKEVHTHVVKFNSKEPGHWLRTSQWAWYDTPASRNDINQVIPPQGMTVWSFNYINTNWFTNNLVEIEITDWQLARRALIEKTLTEDSFGISSLAFIKNNLDSSEPIPNTLVLHLFNNLTNTLRLQTVQLWLPSDPQQWSVMNELQSYTNFYTLPENRLLSPGETLCAEIALTKVPLAYVVIGVELQNESGNSQFAWSYQKVRLETFDICGYIEDLNHFKDSQLSYEPFIKTLKKMHVNTVIFQNTSSAKTTNASIIYDLNSMKQIGPIQDAVRSTTLNSSELIHAIDYLGEVQSVNSESYKIPQEVYFLLEPYRKTQFPVAITMTDPTTWHLYSGLADYPNLKVFRICTQAPDNWSLYTRWPKPVRWAAPLETLVSLADSLRNNSRPLAIAACIQGPGANWPTVAGRSRPAPTAEELKAQALLLLGSKITSFYWANLSIQDIVKYRDLIDEITDINRIAAVLSDILCAGSLYWHNMKTNEPLPGWFTSTIIAPKASVLIAVDLSYSPTRKNVFSFKKDQICNLKFKLPTWLRNNPKIFKYQPEGFTPVQFQLQDKWAIITDTNYVAGAYIAVNDLTIANQFNSKLKALRTNETNLNFNPSQNNSDFNLLVDFINKSK